MKSQKSQKLWGGRFRTLTQKAVERFTHSLAIDQRLAREDLLGSIAHARMLGKQGIIPAKVSHRLVRGLQELLQELDKGRLSFDSSCEDVHTAIQNCLERKAGEACGYLHAARSRNDQVVTTLRLYCKRKIKELSRQILRLQETVLSQAQNSQALLMPGYTHLRQAQPVAVGHLLLSYLPELERDRERLQAASVRLDELPLGSGALTGTGLPIDRKAVAKELGFSRISENSIDAVTSRDFVGELLLGLALLAVHLSRISEDLILWSSEEFGFLHFRDDLLTGSSMMPQKQNPDFLELTRAGACLVIGNGTALLTLLKGLPSGYQRDLQNDKELLFGAIDRIEGKIGRASCRERV